MRQIRFGTSIAVGVTLLAMLRVVLDWPDELRWWLVPLGLAAASQAAALPLPWARIVRRPHVRELLFSWWLAELPLIYMFAADDKLGVAVYVAAVTLVIMLAAALYPPLPVIGLGAVSLVGLAVLILDRPTGQHRGRGRAGRGARHDRRGRRGHRAEPVPAGRPPPVDRAPHRAAAGERLRRRARGRPGRRGQLRQPGRAHRARATTPTRCAATASATWCTPTTRSRFSDWIAAAGRRPCRRHRPRRGPGPPRRRHGASTSTSWAATASTTPTCRPCVLSLRDISSPPRARGCS